MPCCRLKLVFNQTNLRYNISLNENSQGVQILQSLGVFKNKTTVPFALVGYEIVIATSALDASLAI